MYSSQTTSGGGNVGHTCVTICGCLILHCSDSSRVLLWAWRVPSASLHCFDTCSISRALLWACRVTSAVYAVLDDSICTGGLSDASHVTKQEGRGPRLQCSQIWLAS